MTGFLAAFRQTAWMSLVATALVIGSTAGQPAAALAASAADTAAGERIESLGKAASYEADKESGEVTAISITDGSTLTADDVALFASLPKLTSLKILNCGSSTMKWLRH